MTPLEFKSFMEGYDNRIRKEYEQARFISYFSIKPHLSKQAASSTMNKLIPFGWDTKEPAKRMTKEEFDSLRTKWKI